MTEKKRFKLHIKWHNIEKTEGEATLTDNGQPLIETEQITDARLLKNILNDLYNENKQLKQTMKEVAELLSEEVDLFSNKAIEHDICAYVELKELDNKDAYYMAISTKKAIKILKGDVE